MPSAIEIREELVSEFAGIADVEGDFLPHCAAIGALLSGGSGVGVIEDALVKLDKRMFKVIDSRLRQDVRDGMAKKADRRSNFGEAAAAGAFRPKSTEARQAISAHTATLTTSGTDPFRKVLVTALAEHESGLNYPHNVDERFHPRYVAFVPGKVFLQNVARGAHWKDVGASPDHGEFTHRLQWYVIAASETVPANKVGAVYRAIGSCGLSAVQADGIGQKALWARLLDRPGPMRSGTGPGGTTTNTDYRCPETFSSYLRGGKAKFPLLAQFLTERHLKRSGGGDSDAFPSQGLMKNYCARKLFKQSSYENLLAEQKSTVDGIVGKTGVLEVPV